MFERYIKERFVFVYKVKYNFLLFKTRIYADLFKFKFAFLTLNLLLSPSVKFDFCTLHYSFFNVWSKFYRILCRYLTFLLIRTKKKKLKNCGSSFTSSTICRASHRKPLLITPKRLGMVISSCGHTYRYFNIFNNFF
jgi:hypothetical protein